MALSGQRKTDYHRSYMRSRRADEAAILSELRALGFATTTPPLIELSLSHPSTAFRLERRLYQDWLTAVFEEEAP